jgi:hypothetical protein
LSKIFLKSKHKSSPIGDDGNCGFNEFRSSGFDDGGERHEQQEAEEGKDAEADGHALQEALLPTDKDFFLRASVIPFPIGFCYSQVAILL